MSTTVTAPRSGLAKWSALGGAAYVVLFTAGVLIKDSGVPDFDANPAKVIDYYSDSGHRDKIALGWGLAILGLFCFVWFIAALRQFLARIDGDGFLTTVATIGGAIYAATSLTGISLETAVQTMSDDTFHDQVYPGLIHGARDAGYVIHASGGVGVGALIVATSVAAARAGSIPGWAGWTGVVIGVLAVGSVFFFPIVLLAVWLLVASIALFMATPATGATPSSPLTPAS
jgi:hypothetical protein